MRRSVLDPRADLVAGFSDIMPIVPLTPPELDAVVRALKALGGEAP